MHSDCHEYPTRSRYPWYHFWHLSLLCLEWCCEGKSESEQLSEFVIKVIVAPVLLGALISGLVILTLVL